MKRGRLKRVMTLGGIATGIILSGCSEKEVIEIETGVRTGEVEQQATEKETQVEVINMEEAAGLFDDESIEQLTQRLSHYPISDMTFKDGAQLVLDNKVLEPFESTEVGIVSVGEEVINQFLSVKGCLSFPYLVIQFEEAGMIQLTANELATIDWTNKDEVKNALVTATMLYGEFLDK